MDLQHWRLTFSHPDTEDVVSIPLGCTEMGHGTGNQEDCTCLFRASQSGTSSKGPRINLGDVSDWLNSVLNVKCTLSCLYASNDASQSIHRRSPQQQRKKQFGSFANGEGLSLLTTTSILKLEDDLSGSDWNKNLDISRFRMNILIEMVGQGPVEDEWEEFIIGDCAFDKPKSCSRCDMVMVNQATGQKDGKPVFLALGERRHKTGKMSLGVICKPTRLSHLKVRDPVHVVVDRSAP